MLNIKKKNVSYSLIVLEDISVNCLLFVQQVFGGQLMSLASKCSYFSLHLLLNQLSEKEEISYRWKKLKGTQHLRQLCVINPRQVISEQYSPFRQLPEKKVISKKTTNLLSLTHTFPNSRKIFLLGEKNNGNIFDTNLR